MAGRGAAAGTATAGWMRLQPAAGPPGTRVQVTGYRPGGPTAGQAGRDASLGFATLCWGPCASSLTLSVPVTWSERRAGAFTTSFTVPAVPWLTTGGPHPLVAGTYTVGLQCLAPAAPGCREGAADMTATFALRAPAPERCVSRRPCAWVRLSPAGGPPGATVHVRGWAPLTEVIGAPMGYSLVLAGLPGAAGVAGTAVLAQVQQAADGTLSGSFQIPAGLPGLGALTPGRHAVALQSLFPGPVTLAPTTLRVTPAPGWAALGPRAPAWVARNGGLMAQDPLHPERLAYCAPRGGIEVSRDGGAHWVALSTAGAAAALKGSGYELLPTPEGNAGPPCTGLVLDPGLPDVYYATFAAGPARYGAPPVFTLGLWTADGGRSWRLVPAPRGFAAGQFGGFQTDGRGVLALFGHPSGSPPRYAWVAERAPSGGAASPWRVSLPTCPASGPCLRFGPAPNGLGSCAMHGAPQPLLAAAGGSGRAWRTLGAVSPNWCELAELAALGRARVALISADPAAPYPLMVSTDGGDRWTYVALPPLPGQPDQYPGPLPGLQLLPDGTLWTTEFVQTGGKWRARMLLLRPGARAWCAVGGAAGWLPSAGVDPNRVQVVAGRLWWFAADGTGHGVSLATLRCGAAR